VPFSPYVSTIGFLKQTGFRERVPFIFGGFLFCLMGLIPPVGYFFSMLPLSIGSAVLFVAYLQLLSSSWSFFRNVKFNSLNIYRSEERRVGKDGRSRWWTDWYIGRCVRR